MPDDPVRDEARLLAARTDGLARGVRVRREREVDRAPGVRDEARLVRRDARLGDGDLRRPASRSCSRATSTSRRTTATCTTRRSGAARTWRASRSASGSRRSRTWASPISGVRRPATSRGRSRGGTTGWAPSTGGGGFGSTSLLGSAPVAERLLSVTVDREERKPTSGRGQAQRPRAGGAHPERRMTELPGPLVDAAWLEAHLDAGDLVVADVRWVAGGGAAAARALFEAGHIPGAVYLEVDDDLAAAAFDGPGRHPLPSPEAFAATMASCRDRRRHRGGRLRRRAWLLRGASVVDARRAGRAGRAPRRWTDELGRSPRDRAARGRARARGVLAQAVAAPMSSWAPTRSRGRSRPPTRPCSTPACPSATAARWNRSIRWRATSPGRSAHPGWRTSTRGAVGSWTPAPCESGSSRSGSRSIVRRSPTAARA